LFLAQVTVHNKAVVYYYLVSNIFLTSLQVLWLGEIIAAVRKSIAEDGVEGAKRREMTNTVLEKKKKFNAYLHVE